VPETGDDRSGSQPGNYNVVVEATEGEYQSETREAEVTLGENTDLGTIDLNPIEE
jgi:hypothetical protein